MLWKVCGRSNGGRIDRAIVTGVSTSRPTPFATVFGGVESPCRCDDAFGELMALDEYG